MYRKNRKNGQHYGGGFDDLIVITDSGVLMRQPIAAIRTIGRVTQGVKLVKLDQGTIISSITRLLVKKKQRKTKRKRKKTTKFIEGLEEKNKVKTSLSKNILGIKKISD